MTPDASIIPALTPSEAVLLHAASFAGRASFSEIGYRPPLGGPRVVIRQAAQLAWVAAFLAVEQGGDMRLSIEPSAASQDAGLLYVKHLGTCRPWPIPSLEELITTLAVGWQDGAPGPDVRTLVNASLPTAADPFRAALDMLEGHLTGRDLLVVVRRKWLGLVSLTRYQLTERTFADAQACAAEVRKLFATCAAARPELWNRLLAQVSAGIESCGRAATDSALSGMGLT